MRYSASLLRAWRLVWQDTTFAFPAAIAFLVVSCIMSSAMRPQQPEAGGATCDSPYQDVTTAGFLGAFALGCLMMLSLAMVGGYRSRADAGIWRAGSVESASALILLANCTFHFIFISRWLAPYVCVYSIGGYSATQRPQMPQQQLFWICCTAPILMALGRMVNLPLRTQRVIGAEFAAMLVAVTVSTYSQVFALWVTMLAFGAVLHVTVLFYMLAIFAKALAQSKDAFTSRLIYWIRPFSCCIWCGFPALWVLGQCSVVSVTQEWTAWPLLDIAFKGSVSLLLVLGSFYQQSRGLREVLDIAEAQRVQAQASKDDVSRRFLRWTLHELRVPLQGALLAVEEIRDGLESGDLHTSVEVADAGDSASNGAPTAADSDAAGALLAAPAAISVNASGAAYREAGRMAVSSISTVSKHLDNFLSLAKIEDGRMELEPAEVRVRPWLTEVTASFMGALRAKNLALHVSVADDVPRCMVADGNRLRQVVTNYISNAIKFSPVGGAVLLRVERVLRSQGRIMSTHSSIRDIVSSASLFALSGRTPSQMPSARQRASAAAGSATPAAGVEAAGVSAGGAGAGGGSVVAFLHFFVEDAGPGIAADEIPLLFQPFSQIRAGALQQGGGTGLGLALCKKVVELAGGTVGVESAVGAGARFWFEVPLDGSSGASTDANSAAQASEEAASPSPSPSQSVAAAAAAASIGGAAGGGGGGGDQALFSMTRHRGDAPAAGAAASMNDDSSAALAAGGAAGGPLLGRRRDAVDRATARAARPTTGPTSSQGAVLLPPLPGQVARAAAPNAASAAGGNAGRQLRTVTRVVVVDDTYTNRELFARQLQRNGCEVIFTAEHGHDCLDKAGALVRGAGTSLDAQVDVWFVDGVMPVMGGLELTRELRGLGVRAPIVVITGNALDADRRQFLAAGADAVLPKPVIDLREQLASVAGLRLPLSPQPHAAAASP